jgi:hypothetical protein
MAEQHHEEMARCQRCGRETGWLDHSGAPCCSHCIPFVRRSDQDEVRLRALTQACMIIEKMASSPLLIRDDELGLAMKLCKLCSRLGKELVGG